VTENSNEIKLECQSMREKINNEPENVHIVTLYQINPQIYLIKNHSANLDGSFPCHSVEIMW
jgi:hypothetical protein